EPAAWSVWQLPQPALVKTFAPAGSELAAFGSARFEPEPPQPVAATARASTAARPGRRNVRRPGPAPREVCSPTRISSQDRRFRRIRVGTGRKVTLLCDSMCLNASFTSLEEETVEKTLAPIRTSP